MSVGPVSMLQSPEDSLGLLTTGSGLPATVFAHGLAGSIETTRPFGSGVTGSRTFFNFRGLGVPAAARSPWTYPALAEELRAAADHVGAGQALGVSMGAGALCTLLARTPLRFERLVFVLPSVLDRARADALADRMVAMAQCVDDRDEDALTHLLLEGEPASVRSQPAVQHWCRRQAGALVGTAVSTAMRALPKQVPLSDRAELAAVTVPALVIAQEGDPAHPVRVAEQLAAALPGAHLEVMAPGGILWRHRARMRELVGGFLSAGPPRQGAPRSQPIGGRQD
jgi:pimeloyl-ACP methyl ester carboxylesterase